MSRLQSTFERLRGAHQKALITYIVAGDPRLDVTVPAMHSLVAGGADIIELGVPFSDPSAEGVIIQQAHERALNHATNLPAIFNCIKEFRQTDNSTPVVLMGYANPIEWMGYEKFASAASTAAVDAILTVDIPPEEAVEFNAVLSRHQLNNVYLLAPTSSDQRIENACAIANGFIYYVSLKGVTGSSKLDALDVNQRLQHIRQYTELPVCVGFGIKDAESAKSVATYADGVVVGSALVELMSFNQTITSLTQQLTATVKTIRQAIDSVASS